MPQARQEEEQQGGGILRTALQSAGIFLLVQFASKQFFGSNQSNNAASPSAAAAVPAFTDRPAALAPDAQFNKVPQTIAPIWPVGTAVDIRVYVSPSLVMPSLKSMPAESLVIDEKSFGYGNFKENRLISTTFPVPKEAGESGNIWAHFYVGEAGAVLDPTASNYDMSKAYHFPRPLNQVLPKKKVKKTRNLLSAANSTEEDDGEDSKAPVFASYYHPNVTLSMIPDSGVLQYPTLHPAVRQFIQLERTGARDATGQNGWYYPIIYQNTFWQLRDHMTEINSTVKRLPLHVKFNNLKNWKFSIYSSMDEGIKEQSRRAAMGEPSPGGGDGSEMEMFKKIILDSNVYLLGTTAVASVLHMIFEGLAFKNDVQFWRKKKDNVGTSVRTIIANVIMQGIILLYLMDNNENTSWMILFGQGMGIAIEAWKITKTVNVRVRPTAPGSLIPYSVVFEDKHKLSETEKKTEEYDQIAFKYLYRVAIPLLLAYAAYSLVYETHKSWYSFIIATLVGSVYAYGFLMMVPSLYINYRLKSVAHMPGKAMMYKFLNTFIDDLFAFTIKMPILHRLATLRDDVIFFVYLYQSFKYKVDYSRVNEFGQGGEEEEAEEKVANKPLTSVPDSDELLLTKEGEKEEATATGTGKDGKASARKRK